MDREKKICTECESEYYKDRSEMMGLCTECAYTLYGYPKCEHEFKNARCTICGWNGQTSEYLKKTLS